VGPFEEGKDGLEIVSDVVKVEAEDPATPGSSRAFSLDRLCGNPGTISVSQCRLNKTKQHMFVEISQKVLRDNSDAHYPLSLVIELGIRHSQKTERPERMRDSKN